jgi:phosphopantetheinyl transferase
MSTNHEHQPRHRRLPALAARPGASTMNAATIRLWTVDLGAIGPLAVPNDTARLRQQARQRALDHVALQAGVEVVRSCPVCGEEGHGRLTIRSEDADVSVAWAGRWGVVALADCRLGIDVELLRGAPSPVTSALAPQEVAALAHLSGRARAESFLRLWTAKEAVAKADGRGLTLPLAQLDAAPVMLEGQATVAVDGTNWHVVVWDYEFPDGERAALAIATDTGSLRIVWSPNRP